MSFDESLLTPADRPDPRRTDAELYPVRFAAQFRLDDLDFNGHVNNIAVNVLHQESRATLMQSIWPRDGAARSLQLIAVQFVTHYLAEGFYPGGVECCAGVGRIGGSSFVVATALFDADRCLGVADTAMVVRAADGTGGASALGERVRTALTAYRLGAPG